MKRLVVVLVVMALLLSGCAVVETEGDQKDASMFVQIEQTSTWRIVYQKDTRVMYAVSNGSYSQGSFTLLVNSDGTPMIWEG